MANEIQGWSPKLKINSTLFDVETGEPELQVESTRADNTGTGADKVNLPNKRGFTFSFRAQRRTSANPHAAPINFGRSPDLTQGNSPGGFFVVPIAYYPLGPDSNGVLDDTQSWRNAAFTITSYRESFDAKQGLLMIDVRGESSGQIKLPGES